MLRLEYWYHYSSGYGLKIKVEVSVVPCNVPKFVFCKAAAVGRVQVSGVPCNVPKFVFCKGAAVGRVFFFTTGGCDLWFPVG